MKTTHKISIQVEGPVEDKSYNRPTVFSVHLESDLPVARIQTLTNKLLALLTAEADPKGGE